MQFLCPVTKARIQTNTQYITLTAVQRNEIAVLKHLNFMLVRIFSILLTVTAGR